MAQQVTQKQVNQKCDLLKAQNEEITANKIRRLIGGNLSMLDLVEKVTLYKENKSKAIEAANAEAVSVTISHKDELVELIENVFAEFQVDKKDLVMSLRNKLTDYIANEVSQKTAKIKEQQVELSNKNDSLEISGLTINKRYKELLERYNSLKDESYSLKQNYNSKAAKYMEQENLEKSLLAWEDFKGVKEQLSSLGSYAKLAVYDKNGQIIIKFPATDFLTQECRSGKSRYLKAKTVYDYSIQAWVLSEFSDIAKTLDFLKRNRFVLSKELETIVYHRKQSG
ncbi:hypothetical protein QIW31_04110 [Francisellaceae bacterium CB299]|jgi:hypothetical protein